MANLQTIYLEILASFPSYTRPVIAAVLIGLIIYVLIQGVRKNLFWLILLLLLLPAAYPLVSTLIERLIKVFQYMWAQV